MKQIVQVVVAMLAFSALWRVCSAITVSPVAEAPTEAPRGFEPAATAEDRIRAVAPDELEAWEAAIAAHEAARDRLRTAAPAELAAWRAAAGEAHFGQHGVGGGGRGVDGLRGFGGTHGVGGGG